MAQVFERAALYKEVWTTPMTKLGAKYSLSDNGLRNICKVLAIPLPKAGHWARIAVGQKIERPRLPDHAGPETFMSYGRLPEPLPRAEPPATDPSPVQRTGPRELAPIARGRHVREPRSAPVQPVVRAERHGQLHRRPLLLPQAVVSPPSVDVQRIPPTVNAREAARILQVHPETLMELIRGGAIPAAKIGSAWVMMTRDVLAYVEKIILEQTADRLLGRPRQSVRRRLRNIRAVE